MTAKTMAEVLMVHFPNAESGYPGDKYRIFCDATGCGFASKLDHYGAAMSAFIAHQSAALSAAGFGLVADAKAEALEEAADVMDKSAETLVMMWGDEPMNRVALATLTTTRHEARRVRNRAAALRGNS